MHFNTLLMMVNMLAAIFNGEIHKENLHIALPNDRRPGFENNGFKQERTGAE